MLNAWFGSTSSRRSQSRRKLSSPSPAPEDAQSGPSEVSSVSQATVGLGPLQNLASDVPLDEVHARINDRSVYAPTPSLIHSAEKEVGTLRTSNDAPASLDAKQPPAPTDHAQETLFTPQDAIIAQVFGKSVQPAPDLIHATPPPPSGPSVSLRMTSDSLPPLPSLQTAPSSKTRPGPTLTIYDPFSGSKLGSERTPTSPSTATPGGLSSPAPPPAPDDSKLWASLERILGLQAEIAAMHVDMESVGGRGLGNIPGVGAEGGDVEPRKRSRRGQTLPIGDEETEEAEPEGVATGGAISEISTDHSHGGDEDEDEEDEEDIHGYGRRGRDEEFARLAEQFTQRKTAIGRIMNKLDDLSTALKTFHTLPAPLFDLATAPSHTDTTSSAPSNASATSFLPPLHGYPGRSSPPLSPLQFTRPVTPPNVPLTPPVPPISTLAPPAFSGGPSAQPGLVTPVLPRTVLPTIISGSTHVESPAEMDPAHSVFRRVP